MVSSEVLPATVSQDLMAIVLSVTVLFVAVRVREDEHRKHMAVLEVHGFYFYAYGIYVIE